MKRLIEKMWVWLAWHLPRQLVYWAVVRAAVHGRVDYPADQIVSDVTKRWWNG